MFRFIFRSKLFFSALRLIVISIICFGCSGFDSADNIEGEKYVIYPTDYDSKDDLKWSEYLYRHLKKRGGENSPVFYDKKVKDGKRIYVHFDKKLKHDFTISNKDGALHLTTSTIGNTVWLLHQYMRHVGNVDKRFPNHDLPATIVSFADTVGNFTFKYRDVYAPPSLDEDTRGVLDLNCIDESWGIWGHNIGVTITDKSDHSIYASIKGVRNPDQYCFTSEKLYKHIEKYINNNYGNIKDKSINFAILPNDNALVCQCPGCVATGNTTTNATPAVTSMIKRLAKRFQQHKFFTSAYVTTKTAPKDKLPQNVGVIVSVIDWQPNRKSNDRQKQDLQNLIDQWKRVCSNIYIWDYINNYDDYFTPYPILQAMQDRFRFYKQNGIEGVFLNGSGYDYSTFSDMETCVLAQLMMNVDLDLESLIRDYFQRMYPATGKAIGDFYVAMLDKWNQSAKDMPYYGGISDKIDVYLDLDNFKEFYDYIVLHKREADEEEAYLLRRLITTLTYTCLEIARHEGYRPHGFAEKAEGYLTVKDHLFEWIDVFNDGYQAYNLNAINEAGDKSADYVNGWKRHLLSPRKQDNMLLGKKLTLKTPENTKNTDVFTDGELGLPVNYYYGWNIHPFKEISITIPAASARGGRQLAINFFSHTRHRIQLPSKIEVYDGNTPLCSENLQAPTIDGAYQSRWEKNLHTQISGNLTIKIQAHGQYHIALDEIFLNRQ